MRWDDLVKDAGPRWNCGHPRTEENTQRGKNQTPKCRTCHRERARIYQLSQKQERGDRADDDGLEGSKVDVERIAEERERAQKLGGEFARAFRMWAQLRRLETK